MTRYWQIHIWTALGLCTASQILLAPYYTGPHVLVGVICLAGAWGLAAWALPLPRQAQRPSVFQVALALMLVPFTVLRFPWSTRLCLGLVAIGLTLAIPKKRLCQAASQGAVLMGIVGLIQAAAVSLYETFLADKHLAIPLAWFDQLLLPLCGLPVSTVGYRVFVQTPTATLALIPSWDQLALGYGITAAVGMGVLLALGGGDHRGRGLLRAAALLAGYLLLRRWALLTLVVFLRKLDVFWNPYVTAGTFLPVFLLAGGLAKLDMMRLSHRMEQLIHPPRSSPRERWGIASAIAAASLAFLSLYLVIPGPANFGPILIDEGHGRWTSSKVPLDKEKYGRNSVYTYTMLYRWLSHYRKVRQLEGPLSSEALADCSVLILKVPSTPFTKSEIAAIREFVRQGGGLLAIGDHTNVFGSATCLNPLLREFGLSLNEDATYELRTGGLSLFWPSPMAPSPITAYLSSPFYFLTSCTIDTPFSAWKPIMGTGLLVKRADYSQENFFPRSSARSLSALASTFGVFCQLAAVSYGRGRVVVFSDSTCFSSFCLCMDGYVELWQGILAFLSRQNCPAPVRAVTGVLSLIGMVLAWAWLAPHRRVQHWLPLCLGVMLTLLISAEVVREINPILHPPLHAISPFPYVYFDAIHSKGVISPHPGEAGAPPVDRFDTFFVWTERVEAFPKLVTSPSELARGRPYILIDPRSPFPRRYLEWLRRYVSEEGGKLVVMGSPARDLEATRELLGAFGLEVESGEKGLVLLEGERLSPDPRLPIEFSVANYGLGRVILVSDSRFFSNVSLGGVFTVPDAELLRRYEVVYFLLENLCGLGG